MTGTAVRSTLAGIAVGGFAIGVGLAWLWRRETRWHREVRA